MHAGCFPRASLRRSCQRGSGWSNCATPHPGPLLTEELDSLAPGGGEGGVRGCWGGVDGEPRPPVSTVRSARGGGARKRGRGGSHSVPAIFHAKEVPGRPPRYPPRMSPSAPPAAAIMPRKESIVA